MSCCNNNCNHDPCGSSFNQAVTKAAQYAQYAQTQANLSQEAWEEFNALYLGAFAVAPTQDNEGNPLQTGALYWNSMLNSLWVWNGAVWMPAVEGELYLGGFAVAPTLDNEGNPLQVGNLYWNTASNNLWAYNGASWVRTNFNETTPFLATGANTLRNLATRSIDFVNPLDFGAIGDGNSHPLSSVYPTLAAAQAVYPFVTSLSQQIDWAAIQAAVNEAMKIGKMVYITGAGPYMISDTIIVKIQRALTPLPPGSPGQAIHFADNVNAIIKGFGTPTLKATNAIPYIIELTNNFTFSAGPPFYCLIEGIGFNGNNLATTGIYSNFSMHNRYVHNRFWNLQEGIRYRGYGVAQISFNTFEAKDSIVLQDGGGDSVIDHNDFYTPQNIANTTGVYIGNFGGNTRILNNTFSNGWDTSLYPCYCIYINNANRDVTIENNEFCTYTSGVKAVNNPALGNQFKVILNNNHTNPCTGENPGKLIEAEYCTEFIITNNFGNGKGYGYNATTPAMDFTNCSSFKILNNRFAEYTSNVILMNDCTDFEVSNNSFQDYGKSSINGRAIDIYSSGISARNYFKNNYFRQTNASWGKYAIYENTGVDNTFCFENTFVGLSEPYGKVGVNSIMQRTEYLAAIPATGSFYQGDIIWNTAPIAGGSPGWVCTTSGVNTFVFKAMANLAP